MATALPQSIQAAIERWGGRILDTIGADATRPQTPGDGSYADMLWYHLDTGGKRLRPIIVLLTSEALGADPEHALPFACGVELLHNATLVHDDYQDGDTVRRGEPTIWQRYGWEQSINAGDGLYFSGLGLVAQTPIADRDLRRLTAMTAQRMLQVIQGQVDEFRLKGVDRPTEAEYMGVIRGKTAGLFALPIEGAAICAGLPDEEVTRLAQVGDTMGLLFQVQDDLLDLIGQKGRDQIATDIAEGKPSLPVVHALNNAGADDAATLAGIVNKPRSETTPADIRRALDLLHANGSIEYGLNMIRTWRAELTEALQPPLDGVLGGVVTAIVAPIAESL